MLEFRILGPLEVCWDGRPLRLPGLASRQALALLVLRSGTWTTADRLIDDLWQDQPPASARKAMQMHVTRLRRALGPRASVLVSGPAGYRLEISPEQVDAVRFERLVRDAETALAVSEPERARALLVDALGLWRGAPLAELSLHGASAAELVRLEELQLVALEQRIEADLQLGRHDDVIGELRQLVAVHGWRERLHAQLMLALYRAGRQAEALEVYQQARRELVGELGLEPGPELRALEQAILRHAAELQAVERGAVSAEGRPPAPATALFGRDRERGELAALLGRSDVRLVSIIGPGGVGKTRLALDVAELLRPMFGNDVHWVELAPVVRAEDVASKLAQVLGVTPQPAESAAESLFRFLEARRPLLLLDNFEHLLAAAAFVGALVAHCREATVLITSRQALELRAERRYPLAPLPVPAASATAREIQQTAASALFLDAAGRYGVALRATAANAPTIATICARLDGLPLALELAAARSALLAPDQLAARLGAALSALGTGPRDAPDRQRTLRATIDWSYDLLESDEREAFTRFAVFAGGATLDAAEAVTGAALDSFAGLVDKHLLGRHDASAEPRLAMLQTVRAYALEQLAEDPEQDAVRARHCRYYAELAGMPAVFLEPASAWLRSIEREIDNLRAALAWATARDSSAALGLAGSLGELWVVRGSVEEGLRSLESVLEAAGPDAPARELARIQSLRSYLLFRSDDVGAFEQSALRSLELARTAGDDTLTAHAWAHLVAAAHRSGREDEARAHARRALRHAREAQDGALIAHALALLAPSVPWEQGQPLYDEAIALLRDIGSRRRLCVLHSNMAVRAMAEGRYAEALALLGRAMPLAQEEGDPQLLSGCLGDVGLAELLSGQHARARDAFVNQIRLCRQHGFRWQAGEGLLGLAAIAAARGDRGRAARLAGAARRTGGRSLSAIEVELEHRFLADARDETWAAAFGSGTQLPFADAIRYALDEPTVAGATPPA